VSLNGTLAVPITKRVDEYELTGNQAIRRLTDRSGFVWTSTISAVADRNTEDLQSLFDQSWLRSRVRPTLSDIRGTIRTVDLFAGCGGLTLGLQEAARALNMGFEAVLANDLELSGLRVYERNFPGVRLEHSPIEKIFDGDLGAVATRSERKISSQMGQVDIVVGGPPCQGHSDLNNHTRRSDPKNELYLRMARFCEIVRPTHVVIENVPGVLHDQNSVAQRTWAVLESLGYSVSTGILDVQDFGAAQRRKRSLTLGSLSVTPNLPELVQEFGTRARSVAWAIEDLEDQLDKESVFDSPPSPRPESQARINYLFEHSLFDLPDEQRPDCHRLKRHSYKSMYGRMHYDRPAQTITTGFGVMGRGRYVHPTQHRTLTPHEAARIQGFPDFFTFGDAKRTELHTLIGNAVPSKLGYVVGGHLLR
jgi:DNA (cytosine-5)-methyltransferase 1